MTDEKVKEARERLGKFIGPAPYTGVSGYDIYPGGIFCQDGPNEFYADLRAILSDHAALQAERDKLAAEVERLRLAILGGEDAPGLAMSLTEGDVLSALADNHYRSRDRAEAAEAKLTALVEDGQFLLDRIADHESVPDSERDFCGHVLPAAARFRQALAHHSAPVGPQTYGQVALNLARASTDSILSAPPSTPTSAPVEDVGGRRKALKDMDRAELLHIEDRCLYEAIRDAQSALERGAPAGRYSWLDAPVEILRARAFPALIQPQGEERS